MGKDGIYHIYTNDTLISTTPIKNGTINGEVITYYPNNKISSRMNFNNGVFNGKVVHYALAGNIKKEEKYLNGKNMEFRNIIMVIY